MLYRLKGRFQQAIGWMGGSWMTANQATLFGFVFIALITASFYFGLRSATHHWLLLLVPLFVPLRLVMNALDGLIARRQNTATPAGEYMNEFSDIVGDTICYGVLAFTPAVPMLPVALVVIAAWACEFAGIMGKCMPGGQRRHESALGGKTERGIWFGILAIILYCKPDFAVAYYLYAIALLSTWSAIMRIRKGISLAAGHEYKSFTPIGK